MGNIKEYRLKRPIWAVIYDGSKESKNMIRQIAAKYPKILSVKFDKEYNVASLSYKDGYGTTSNFVYPKDNDYIVLDMTNEINPFSSMTQERFFERYENK